jgi:4'-phosphopantetheinyl transferase EntD
VARPEERASLWSAPANAGVCWDRLLFSVKESAYKAWYPTVHDWIDFQAATVTIDISGTFTASMVKPNRNAPVLLGRWQIKRSLLTTAAYAWA